MGNNKTLLETTASGKNIYIDNETLKHMEAHPDVDMNVVKEAIRKIDDYEGPFKISSVDKKMVATTIFHRKTQRRM